MSKQERLLEVAYDWLVASFYLTNRQRQIGRIVSLGSVTCIHYEWEWRDRWNTADRFFAWREEPESVVEQIKAFGPSEDHHLYVVADRPSLSLMYMSLDCSAFSPAGYLMARDLDTLPVLDVNLDLHEPVTPGDAMLLNSIEGADLTLAEDLLDPSLEFYYATDRKKPATMARVARLETGIGWVSHVYTAPASRRKGLASALMTRVLSRQKEAGDEVSLLMATPDAHDLYQKLGYNDLAPVLNFVIG